MNISTLNRICLIALFVASATTSLRAADVPNDAKPFFVKYCNDCHAGGAKEGGLDLGTLETNLADAATFARWERIFDRVAQGEMPPKDTTQPTATERAAFEKSLSGALTKAHADSRGTVLRRLNRLEYENTLNDLFGTTLDLAKLLPEDGRSHEFDNVGSALGLSLVHLQLYMDAADLVLDAAIANTTKKPEPQVVEASYLGSREGDQFIGSVWKKLPDGAVVRFAGGGYPTGMMRGTGVPERGRYRVKVTGYAHQSDQPITFSVGGTSFAAGSEKPIYGFYSFPPDNPTTIELEAVIDTRYMIQIEPYGITDPKRYQRKTIDDYTGPGLAILKVTLEGPLQGGFPSRGHKLLFDGLTRQEIEPRNPATKQKSWYKPQFEIVSTNERAGANRALSRITETAFRRPVKPREVEPYLMLFSTQRAEGASFEDALRTSTIAIFCSPKFLYLQENSQQLDDFALATRLSYFLTRTTPDQELLALAKSGKLSSDKNALRQQTERLLRDPRFDRFIVDFADNWLNLREMDFTAPDDQLFPEFDDYLRYSMPLETHAFLRELIVSNLPVANLVKSDFAMLNSRLAELYELPEVQGATLQKVSLPSGSLRGGLLPQASILKVTANGTNTSPVTRGAWVLERILGETPPPPPPGIPGVEPDIRGAKTLRELLDKHRNVESCQACHQKIDPPGFALECFNPIGGFRENYRSLGEGERVKKQILGRNVQYRIGPLVDPSGELPDGTKFSDFVQFRDLLARQPELLAKTLTEKLLTVATGRELGFSDRPEVNRIVRESAKNGYRVRDLIFLIIESRIFKEK